MINSWLNNSNWISSCTVNTLIIIWCTCPSVYIRKVNSFKFFIVFKLTLCLFLILIPYYIYHIFFIILWKILFPVFEMISGLPLISAFGLYFLASGCYWNAFQIISLKIFKLWNVIFILYYVFIYIFLIIINWWINF